MIRSVMQFVWRCFELWERTTSPVSLRVPVMTCTQGDQRTWPPWLVCYHQSDAKWLPWHHELLTFLCDHHLEKEQQRENVIKKKWCAGRVLDVCWNPGQTWNSGVSKHIIWRGAAAADAAQVHARSEWVLLSIPGVWNFERILPPPPTSTPPLSLVNAILSLHTPLHTFPRVSFLPPPTPPLPLVCKGKSQIYNNCQSQGWQIN